MFKLLRLGGWLSALLAILPLLGLAIIFAEPPTASPADVFGSSEGRNWQSVFREENTLLLLWASLKLGFVVSILSTCLGAFVAWFSLRVNLRGVKTLSVLCLLPLAMPSYVLALSLDGALGSIDGLSDAFREGFWPVCLCLTIVCAPYSQLTIGAALKRLPAAEEEAAIMLGAGRWRRFTTCIWPFVRPATAFSMLISFLYAISDFGALVFLNYPALTWRLFDAARGQDLASAAILGMGLLVCVIPILIAAQLLRGKRDYALATANPRPRQRVSATSIEMVLFFALAAVVIGVGLVLPCSVLADWAIDGFANERSFLNPWESLFDTFCLALLGAIITVLISFPAAWSASRNKEGRLLTQAVYLSSALPGVLVAFGLIAAALQFGQYQLLLGSGTLLFLGYAMRFSAEAFGPLNAGISQLDKRQEESATVLGASPWIWMRRVALPLLQPNIAAAFIIAFLAILKELPITILLGQAMGFTPLAWRIFDGVEGAEFHDAACHALLLIGLALLVAIVSQKWRKNV